MKAPNALSTFELARDILAGDPFKVLDEYELGIEETLVLLAKAIGDADIAMKSAQPVAAEGWQPIETAPRNGDAVLLWAPDYSERASLGWWSENVGAWCADTGTMEDGPTERQDECSGPTHWMPLPVLTARPKRAEGRDHE